MTTYDYCPNLGLSCSTAALNRGCRCAVCGPWNDRHNAERRGGRPPKVVHAASPSCPENGCKASTAYGKLRCRCEVCRGWNASRERRRRASIPSAAIVQLDAQVEEFIRAVRIDPTYIEDILRAALRK